MNPTLQASLELIARPDVAACLASTTASVVMADDGRTVRFVNAAAAQAFGIAAAGDILGRTLPIDAPMLRQLSRIIPQMPSGATVTERVRFYRGLKSVLLTLEIRSLGPLGAGAALVTFTDLPTSGKTSIQATLDLYGAPDSLLTVFADDDILAVSGTHDVLDEAHDDIEALVERATSDDSLSQRVRTPAGDRDVMLVRIGGTGKVRRLLYVGPLLVRAEGSPASTGPQPAAPSSAGPSAPHEPASAAMPEPAPASPAGDAPRARDATPAEDAPPPEDAGPAEDALRGRDDPTPTLVVPDAPLFRFEPRPRPQRFAFELDGAGRWTSIGPELAAALGPGASPRPGETVEAFADRAALDPEGRLGPVLAARGPWRGLILQWPVESTALRVPVELAGLPVVGADRSIAGIRGFGIIRTAEAMADPLETGLRLAVRSAIVPAETASAGAEASASPPASSASGPDLSDAPRTDDPRTDDAPHPRPAEDSSSPSIVPFADAEPDTTSGTPAATMSATDAASASAIESAIDLPWPPGMADLSTAADPTEPRPDSHAPTAHSSHEIPAEVSAISDFIAALNGPESWRDASDTPDPVAARPAIDRDLHDRDGAAEPSDPSVAARLAFLEALGLDVSDLPLAPPTAANATDADEMKVDPAEPRLPDAPAAAAADAEAPSDEHPPEPDRRPQDVLIADDAAPVEWPAAPAHRVVAMPARPDARVVSLSGQTRISPETIRLTGPERNAFRQIAEALGARFEGDDVTPVTPVLATPPLAPDLPPLDLPALPQVERRGDAAGRETRLLDRLPIAVGLVRDETIIHVNDAFLELTGYRDLDDLNTAGGLATLFAGPHAAKGWAGQSKRRPIPLVTRNGRVLPVETRIASVPWQGSEALLVSLIPDERILETPDDTNTKAVLQALANTRERVKELDAIIDAATDGVLMLDAHGRVISANRAAEALFGLERSAFEGRHLSSLLAPESRRMAFDYIDALAHGGDRAPPESREVVGQMQPDGIVPLQLTLGRISAGAEPKYCAILRDVTQWKKSEEDLTAARKRAEEASVLKSEFLARISHEIRTPLNAIIGFSEVMLGERFGAVGNERYKDYLRDIQSSGNHIMSLVNDLLDLSKVEAGKMELKFEAVQLTDLMAECVALMQPQANRDRIIIRSSLPGGLPLVVADQRSIKQIMLNLVSNAIKFTPAGGQVIVSAAQEDTGEMVIRVRDTGFGMTEKEIDIALEPFRQLHTGRGRGGGTGLGLPLTKALVEANRASFRIDSAVNQGTLVQVSFPTARVLAAE